jgi:gluconolactonase
LKANVMLRVPLLALFVLAASAAGRAAEPPLPPTVGEGARLVEVFADDCFFEGPTWDPSTGKLYFTAFYPENQRILRLDASGQAAIWLGKSQGVNGTFLSLEGRLLGAQAYGHRLVSYGFGPEGPSDSETLLFAPGLNQPNDVCQTPNGDIYFTDPDFERREKSAVFRYQRTGEVTKVIDDMPVPNGLIASLDGRTLYVGDSHLALWRAYPVSADGAVGPGMVFFDPPTDNRSPPDGMSIDEQGNLYFSGRGGVWAATSEGKSLGFIPVPEFCSNVTFGGADGRTLYLTCDKKVYALAMNVRGGQFARP